MAAIDLGWLAFQTDFGFGDNAVRLLVAIMISLELSWIKTRSTPTGSLCIGILNTKLATL